MRPDPFCLRLAKRAAYRSVLTWHQLHINESKNSCKLRTYGNTIQIIRPQDTGIVQIRWIHSISHGPARPSHADGLCRPLGLLDIDFFSTFFRVNLDRD
jgi:hypothetical protein